MASIFTSFLPLLCFFLFTVVISTVSAAEFQVGGTVGWRVPASNESQLYNVWASRRQFFIGDSLRFLYKNDSVVVVEKWGFYHCDSSNPIASFTEGDTLISLDNEGTMYFISGDSDRCKKGVNMMLEVMSPVPVRYFPPTISTHSAIAPSPSQVLSMGDDSGLGLGPSSSDSVSVLVSVMVVGFGLGLSMLNIS